MSVTAEDLLKYAAAASMTFLYDAMEHARQAISDRSARALQVSLLQHVAEKVLEPTLAQLDDALHYSAGWPVVTREELGPDCGCCYTHVWHPDRDHEINRSRELFALPCPRGGRHRLIVMAPGEIETVMVGGPDGAG